VRIDPVLGGSVLPTLVAMVVLAVPPILVNAYTGVAEVDRDLVEAGRGMGMREREILLGIELPVALPVVLGGVRSAAVQIIATATLGAIFGSGGLGRFLVDGIAQNDDGQVFGGVLLVATLALATEAAIEILQRLARSKGAENAASPASAIAPGPRCSASDPGRRNRPNGTGDRAAGLWHNAVSGRRQMTSVWSAELRPGHPAAWVPFLGWR